ncbi:hypothetical protein GGX14DRAFT_399440 [Mycena pura]|uniref:Uncharacterized protein n=1 Tax=Mycena pura TaxID=153505 RepID=A0AAD6Y6P9_9AGAR|nr:hypothetical protein GGX14DRAFT_399440 [Mycena pura]
MKEQVAADPAHRKSPSTIGASRKSSSMIGACTEVLVDIGASEVVQVGRIVATDRDLSWSAGVVDRRIAVGGRIPSLFSEVSGSAEAGSVERVSSSQLEGVCWNMEWLCELFRAPHAWALHRVMMTLSADVEHVFILCI